MMKLMIFATVLTLVLLTQVLASVPFTDEGNQVSDESNELDSVLQSAVKRYPYNVYRRRYRNRCQTYKAHCNGNFKCCKKYTCRCNVTATSCRCERPGLFYRWGK